MSVKEVSLDDLASHFGEKIAEPGLAQKEEFLAAQKHRARRGNRKQKQIPRNPFPASKKAVFTKHAVEQFLLRYRKLNPEEQLKNPAKTAEKILTESKEWFPKGVRAVRRMIKHNCESVRYFVSPCGWRFVVKEKAYVFIVITAERIKPEQN